LECPSKRRWICDSLHGTKRVSIKRIDAFASASN
jgi:hypothetical protein